MTSEVKKPKIVEIKRTPKITNITEEKEEESDDAALDELVDDLPVVGVDSNRDELRKKQLEDITPLDPQEELRKEKKKRFGLF